MANDLIESVLPGVMASYEADGFGRNESRASRYGVIDFVQEQTRRPDSLVTPAIQQLVNKSLDRNISIPVLDTKDVTITNTRTCTIPDSANKSGSLTLTFNTYVYNFTIIPREFETNVITREQIFQHEFRSFGLKMMSTLDSAARNFLEANKNAYNPAAITTYYPVVGNALQVTDAQKGDLFNNAAAILETMDFYGGTNVIASTSLMPVINRLAAQGAGNYTNENFQFNGYKWKYSNRVTNGSGIRATAYLVQDGNVAVVTRLDPDSRAGHTSGSKVWETIDNFPLLNMPVDVYRYTDCTDASAIRPSMTRSYKEFYQLAVDVAFLSSYNSDPATRYNPIVKVEVAAAA